jgi:hypothetical protein
MANFADRVSKDDSKGVGQIAQEWATDFFSVYATQNPVNLYRTLAAKAALPQGALPSVQYRTPDEENVLKNLMSNLYVGFCIGGHRNATDRTPKAFVVEFWPSSVAPPSPSEVPMSSYYYAGAPNMVKRLINGADDRVKGAIFLSAIVTRHRLDAGCAASAMRHTARGLDE